MITNIYGYLTSGQVSTPLPQTGTQGLNIPDATKPPSTESIDRTIESGVSSVTNVNPIYTEKSAEHIEPRHNDPNRFIDKSKFKPGEGGQKFADEVMTKGKLTVQRDGRLRYDADLGRVVGTRGETWGRVVLDPKTGEVINQFPQSPP